MLKKPSESKFIQTVDGIIGQLVADLAKVIKPIKDKAVDEQSALVTLNNIFGAAYDSKAFSARTKTFLDQMYYQDGVNAIQDLHAHGATIRGHVIPPGSVGGCGIIRESEKCYFVVALDAGICQRNPLGGAPYTGLLKGKVVLHELLAHAAVKHEVIERLGIEAYDENSRDPKEQAKREFREETIAALIDYLVIKNIPEPLLKLEARLLITMKDAGMASRQLVEFVLPANDMLKKGTVGDALRLKHKSDYIGKYENDGLTPTYMKGIQDSKLFKPFVSTFEKVHRLKN